jgi:hypothetical protein
MLKYRHPTSEDISKIDAWISVDPAHKDTMTTADFMLSGKGTQCVVVEDDDGTVFYLRFRNALIVETQFPPVTNRKEKVRVARALDKALDYFKAWGKHEGYCALLFNSISQSLISFFEKRGFKPLVNYFKAAL